MANSDRDEGSPDRLINRQYIKNAVQQRFGIVAKDTQIDAIETLTYDHRDVILIAKTGFGKSIVFQAVPFIFPTPRSALIIMPLIALEEEQCRKLRDIPDCKPFVLNGDNNNRHNLQLIRQGAFTHGMESLSNLPKDNRNTNNISLYESRNCRVERF
jgi:superfamily II DNA helicase RecQ